MDKLDRYSEKTVTSPDPCVVAGGNDTINGAVALSPTVRFS